MLRYLATSGGPVYKVVALNSSVGDCQTANGTEDCSPLVSDLSTTLTLDLSGLHYLTLFDTPVMRWKLVHILTAFCDGLTKESHWSVNNPSLYCYKDTIVHVRAGRYSLKFILRHNFKPRQYAVYNVTYSLCNFKILFPMCRGDTSCIFSKMNELIGVTLGPK